MSEEKKTEVVPTAHDTVVAPARLESAKLSDVEQKAAGELADSFSSFMEENFEICEDDGIKTLIPTGIDILDVALGGGFAPSFIQIVGPPGSGKTALAIKILASGQKYWPGQFIGMFADSEEAMTSERLAQLGVINPPLKPYTGLTVERVFKMIEGICTYKDSNPKLMEIPCAIIWDSLANTVTEKGATEDDPKSVVGQKALMLSHLLPKYVRKMNKYNIALCAINQFRDKIDMGIFKQANDLKYLGDKSLPGGKSAIFNATQLLWVKPMKAIEGEYGFNGFRVDCKLVKNKYFTPNIPFTLVFSFERGFSNFWSNFEMLKTYKRVKSGAWCTLTAYPTIKFRQKDAILRYRDTPDFKTAWDNEVKDCLQTEFIEQYASTSADAIDIY